MFLRSKRRTTRAWICREEDLIRERGSVGKADAPHERGEAWISAQRIEEGIRLDLVERAHAGIHGPVEPCERFIDLTEAEIRERGVIRTAVSFGRHFRQERQCVLPASHPAV